MEYKWNKAIKVLRLKHTIKGDTDINSGVQCVPCPCTISYKNTNHQQMHKESFVVNRNTLLHVSTLLGHLQGELFVIVTLMLHFIVEWECAVDCVLRCFLRRELCSTQSTAHSHSTIKCNLGVTITKSSPWRWPSRVETCRSVLRLMIKLSLWVCWWLVFCINSDGQRRVNRDPYLRVSVT
jgi:hypothetical protein